MTSESWGVGDDDPTDAWAETDGDPIGTVPDAPFGDRLADAFARHGRLCVGIDPHPSLVASWELPDDADGVAAFGLAVVEACAGRVGIVKPQVALFERLGSAGVSALETVIRAARDAGLVVIADAKRGDIGSTMTAYAEAWLSPGSPLASDAVTLSPYLGVGALAPALEAARRTRTGAFVLAATTDPAGARLQASRDADGASVAAQVVAEVLAADDAPDAAFASCGVVVGATLDPADAGIDVDDARLARLPVLAPGFGAQGATLERALGRLGTLTAGLVVAESRGILSVPRGRLADTVERRAEEVRTAT